MFKLYKGEFKKYINLMEKFSKNIIINYRHNTLYMDCYKNNQKDLISVCLKDISSNSVLNISQKENMEDREKDFKEIFKSNYFVNIKSIKKGLKNNNEIVLCSIKNENNETKLTINKTKIKMTKI